jgi:S-layer protein (TIGR01567 family)
MNKNITAVTLSAIMVLTMFCALVPAVSAVTPEEVEAPYEFFAYVQTDINVNYTDFNLSSEGNPSVLYYDFEEGEGDERLDFRIDGPRREINGSGDNFVYSTRIYYKDDAPGEPYIAWLGEPYFVVENKSDWYLSKLLVDDKEDDTQMLQTGEALTLPKGFELNAVEIDTDGKKAWFTVTQDGKEVESLVVQEGNKFEYEADLNESGDKDNWVLRFNVETVFAGMNTNLVKINKTQLLDPKVVKVEVPDSDTIKDMEIDALPGDDGLEITLDQTDDKISLKKDGTVSFLNDRFNFKINEDGDVGGVLKIVNVGNITPTPTPIKPNETATGTVGPNATVLPTEGVGTPGVTAPPEEKTAVPTPTATKTPGFEGFLAITGLLAVAYLVLRKRE